jgi:hypothetical protein
VGREWTDKGGNKTMVAARRAKRSYEKSDLINRWYEKYGRAGDEWWDVARPEIYGDKNYFVGPAHDKKIRTWLLSQLEES